MQVKELQEIYTGSQREIGALKHSVQESTTDATAAMQKLSELTAEREPIAASAASRVNDRWHGAPALAATHQLTPAQRRLIR